jgi:hypothetical protein
MRAWPREWWCRGRGAPGGPIGASCRLQRFSGSTPHHPLVPDPWNRGTGALESTPRSSTRRAPLPRGRQRRRTRWSSPEIFPASGGLLLSFAQPKSHKGGHLVAKRLAHQEGGLDHGPGKAQSLEIKIAPIPQETHHLPRTPTPQIYPASTANQSMLRTNLSVRCEVLFAHFPRSREGTGRLGSR